MQSLRRLGSGRLREGERERDREGRAAAEGGADADVTAVGADDLVDDREAEAGAVGAGGEERLEDAGEIVGADAAALVLDLDRDEVIGGGEGAQGDLGARARGGGGVVDEVGEIGRASCRERV